MGRGGKLLSATLLALTACVSSDVTSGLPCNRDEQCGGGEPCEQGYCEGPPPGVSVGVSTTAGPTTGSATGDEGSSTTAGCFAPELGCPSCDPIAQDCPDAAGCYASLGLGAECVDPPGDAQLGDPCVFPFDTTCAPGLVCSPLVSEIDCEPNDSCCVQLCDLGAPACATGSCEPLWPVPPEELSHVGFCNPE